MALRCQRGLHVPASCFTLRPPQRKGTYKISTTVSTYTAIYAFGDSLSDAGNDSILTSVTGTEPVSPPYYHTNVAIAGGIASESASVFSNGPVWVQDLALALGLGTLEPSLLGGNDFAYGAAETGSTPQNAGDAVDAAISLPAQLSEFSAATGTVAANALITVSIGANDIFDILAATGLTDAQQAADVSDAVANEMSFIKSMAKLGASNFLVFNVPNLGVVPEVTTGMANGSNQPSAALDATATHLAASYDAQLAAALSAQSAATGETIHILDAYALIDQAAVNPSAFNLTNTTTPVWSGNFSSASSGALAATSLAQQNQYLFWDDYHPTAAVHQDLANVALPEVGANQSADVTVTGAAGNLLTLALPSVTLATEIQLQLAAVTAGIAAGSVTATSITAGITTGISTGITTGSAPTLAGGTTGFAEIDSSTSVALPGGYGTVVDLAGGAATVAASPGSQLVINAGTGSLLYAANTGVETVSAGAGGGLLFGGGAAMDVFGGAGATTLVGGSAGNTVAGGSGNLLAFGGGGMSFIGGSGTATIVGGASALAATLGGAGGGALFGGSAGGNVLASGSGPATLVGGGTGDVLTATGSGNDLLVAGPGAETLNGAASTGNLILFGGSGANALVGGAGSDIFVAGTGNATLTGGGGSNDYFFTDAPGIARTDLITDFNPASTVIGLEGYGGGADAAALASATMSSGGITLSLSDGTHIVLAGAASLGSTNFV